MYFTFAVLLVYVHSVENSAALLINQENQILSFHTTQAENFHTGNGNILESAGIHLFLVAFCCITVTEIAEQSVRCL